MLSFDLTVTVLKLPADLATIYFLTVSSLKDGNGTSDSGIFKICKALFFMQYASKVEGKASVSFTDKLLIGVLTTQPELSSGR